MSTLTMYTGNNCGRCVQAKSIFTQQGIQFETVNIDEHPEAREMLMEKKLLQLPVINDGGNWTSGWTAQILSGILAPRMPAMA